jgi:hypothetical protein
MNRKPIALQINSRYPLQNKLRVKDENRNNGSFCSGYKRRNFLYPDSGIPNSNYGFIAGPR